MYLLAYTVEKAKFEVHNIQFRGQRLRAAALAELSLGGFLELGDGKVVQNAPAPPDDPFLAEVWQEVRAGKPQDWITLIQVGAATAESAVREQLAETGEITIPDSAKGGLLKPLAQHQVIVSDPGMVISLRSQVREPILRDLDPARPPARDLAATVLAAENDLGHTFTQAEHRAHKKTFHAFRDRFDQTIPGLRSALAASAASLRAAGGGWGA